MSNLLKIPINNKSGFAGMAIPATGGKYKPLSVNAIKFGRTHAVNAQGENILINEGYLLDSDAKLYTGQSLFFDGTQYIETGLIIDPTKDFTFLFQQRFKTGGSGQNGSLIDGNRCHFGTDANGIRVGVGNNVITKNETLQNGKFVHVAVRYNAQQQRVSVTNLNNMTTQSFITVFNTPVNAFNIGNIAGTASSPVAEIQKDFYFIPAYLTLGELAAHHQYPELTLYKQNETLKSSFLQQTTLDEMQGGNGFWYPLCENNSLANAGFGSVINLFSPVSQDVVDVYGWGYLGDNVYEVTSALRKDIKLNLESGKDYLLDIEILEANSSPLSFWSGLGTFQLIASNIGTKTLYLNARNTGSILYNTDNGFVGKIRLSNLRELQPIVNYTNSAMRDNAVRLNSAMQSSLLEQDQFNIPISLSRAGELSFNGDQYVDIQSKNITGDWCLDLYVNTKDNTGTVLQETLLACHLLDATNAIVADMNVGINDGDSNLKLTVGSDIDTMTVPSAIISFECTAGVIKSYINGALLSTYAATFTALKLMYMGASSSTAGFAKGVIGSLQLTAESRTEEQRTIEVAKLQSKHEVQ